MQINPFYIGNVKIENPLVLAPLAGITDTVFRKIIKQMGAGLVHSEMISCHALHYDSKKTWKIAEFSPDEIPVSAQIFGEDPDLMAEAAKSLEAKGFSIIDINVGCSVPKVVKGGGGAALARNLPILAKIIEKVVKSIEIPVTIKVRKGWSNQEITAFEICRISTELGISALTIHGRTSAQKYSGLADWEFIKQLKETSKIPIIGNGDIRTPEDAESKLEYSKCDAIMIGRESYSNPWVFRNILLYFEGKPYSPTPTPEDLKSLIQYHLAEYVKRYGEESGTERMRKFIAWYTRGMRNSARFREIMFHTRSFEQTMELIDDFFKSQK
jgi:nifR3 family TIM-barrel protein